LRVKQPRDVVAAAIDLAERLETEGCSPVERLARVSSLVADPELGEAIVSCIESRKRSKKRRFNHERVLGVYAAGLSLILVWLLWQGAKWLYGWIAGAPNEDLPAVAAACGQAILLRLSWHLIKFAGIALADTLNNATYPTVLHQPSVATPDEDALRLDRIRQVIAETVFRLGCGERGRDLYRELSDIEFTHTAARWILFQARIGLFIKANFPPYAIRSRAYLVAGGAFVGCVIGLTMAQRHLVTLAQRDYLFALAMLLVLEFLRAPRPAEVGEPAG
jgi:hypothetical protein